MDARRPRVGAGGWETRLGSSSDGPTRGGRPQGRTRQQAAGQPAWRRTSGAGVASLRARPPREAHKGAVPTAAGNRPAKRGRARAHHVACTGRSPQEHVKVKPSPGHRRTRFAALALRRAAGRRACHSNQPASLVASRRRADLNPRGPPGQGPDPQVSRTETLESNYAPECGA